MKSSLRFLSAVGCAGPARRFWTKGGGRLGEPALPVFTERLRPTRFCRFTAWVLIIALTTETLTYGWSGWPPNNPDPGCGDNSECEGENTNSTCPSTGGNGNLSLGGGGAVWSGGSFVRPGKAGVYARGPVERDLPALAVPGGRRAVALQFRRAQYSTDDYQGGPFGRGATHNYNVLLKDDTASVFIKQPNGKEIIFTNQAGVYSPVGENFSKLTKVSGNFVWELSHGTKYTFDAAHSNRLQSINVPTGQSLTLSYDGASRLTNVTDAAGRNLSLVNDASGRITQITDPLGRAVSYSYDGDSQLTNVTDALGRKVSYVYTNYAGFGLLLRETNARGQTHTYVYNAGGQVIGETNALGHAQTYVIDPVAHVTILTNWAGTAEWLYYNEDGAVTARVDVAGTRSSWLDDKNRITNSLDRLGNRTILAYATAGCGCAGDNNLTLRVDALSRTNAWTYESAFNLVTSFTNALGQVTLWSYDATGNLLTNTDANGKAMIYGYDGAGNRTSAKNANNNTTTFGYDSSGNRTSVTSALGHSRTFSFDPVSRLTSRSDPLGRTETMTYDARDRLTRRVNAASETNSWTHDGNGNVTAWTNALGYVTTYAYDDLDRLTSTTLPAGGGAFLTYAYNRLGNRTNVTDALGNQTGFGYDALGRLTAVTNALGKAWSFTLDAEGRRTRTLDPNSRTNSFVYDAVGQVTAWTNALGNTATFAYDKVGNLTTVTDPRGNALNFGYDPVQRLTNITYGASDTEKFLYDSVGNLTNFLNRAGQSVALTYDADNRLTQKAYTGTNDVIAFAYDAAGQLTGVVAAVTGGSVTNSALRLFYDSAGRLTNEVQTVGQASSLSVGYQYHPDGRRKRLTYPDGTWITYDYNSNGWLTAIRDGGTNSIVTYDYDAAGRRTKRTLENSTFTVYEYDAANQLSAVSHQQTVGAATNQISRYEYWYDAAGNRTQMVGTAVSAVRSESYEYDAADQLTGVTYATNGVTVRRVTYAFDAAGNRTNVTEIGVVTNALTYTVNPLNQYTKTELGAGGARAWWKLDEGSGNTAADSSGNGHTATLVNSPTWISAVSSNGLDFTPTNQWVNAGDDGLEGLTNWTVANWVKVDKFTTAHHVRMQAKEKILFFGFTKTAPRQLRHNIGTNDLWQGDTTSAVLLPSNRWLHVAVSYAAGEVRFYVDGQRTDTIAKNYVMGTNTSRYVLGNTADVAQPLDGQLDDARLYAYRLTDAEVQLLTQARDYSYDAKGNLTGDRVWGYQYDHENRLTVATNGALRIDYRYDAFGRLIERRTSGSAVTTNRMYYAGWQLIAEYNGAGTLQRKYVYGPGIDEPVRMRFTGGVGTNYYYHADGLGSVTEITTNGGFKVESYAYDAYGTPTIYNSSAIPISQSAIGNRLLFTGRDRDPDTTLYNYRYRYYSPSLGRFMQVDPIRLAGGDLNLHTYLGNNPVGQTDPFGLMSAACIAALVEFENALAQFMSDYIRFNPIADLIGGYPHSYGTTVPHGHGVELWQDLNRLSRAWNRIQQDCRDDFCDPPPPVPSPAPASSPAPSPVAGAVGTVVVVGGTAYLIYRGIRLLPSLFPPLWPTLPVNIAVP